MIFISELSQIDANALVEDNEKEFSIELIAKIQFPKSFDHLRFIKLIFTMNFIHLITRFKLYKVELGL